MTPFDVHLIVAALALAAYLYVPIQVRKERDARRRHHQSQVAIPRADSERMASRHSAGKSLRETVALKNWAKAHLEV